MSIIKDYKEIVEYFKEKWNTNYSDYPYVALAPPNAPPLLKIFLYTDYTKILEIYFPSEISISPVPIYYEGEVVSFYEIMEKLKEKLGFKVIIYSGAKTEDDVKLLNRRNVYNFTLEVSLEEVAKRFSTLEELDEIVKTLIETLKEYGKVYIAKEEKYKEKVSVYLPKV